MSLHAAAELREAPVSQSSTIGWPIGSPRSFADRLYSLAGREDADVRMLGSGRPYVLEIINARAAMPPQSYFDEAQRQLNEVRGGQDTVF